MFIVPFRAGPSEFVEHKTHPLYGRVTGFGPPLLTAWLFQKAFGFEAVTQVKHFDWQAKTVGEAIASSQSFVSMASWTAFFSSCAIVLAISAIRWSWHFFLIKATNRYRRDGSGAGPAPFLFFALHTSGIASWLGAWMWVIFGVEAFHYGRPFSIITEFFDHNPNWRLATGALILLAGIKLYRSNTEILLNIYRSITVVKWVRRSTYVIFIAIWTADTAILIEMLH